MARKKVRPSKATSKNTNNINWKRRAVFVACGLAGLAIVVSVRSFMGTPVAEAQLFGTGKAEQQQVKPAVNNASLPTTAAPPKHDVMAVVNGQDIRRDQLAAACVDRFGEEVLEGLVNKRLIEHHCRNRGLTVTAEETSAEIDRMAERFKIGRKQWLEMLQRERGINQQHYERDILWPTLALRKLAADQLTVSNQQIAEAYESQFGEAVKSRLLVVEDRALAEQLHRQLVESPGDFARLAMQHSVDINSASIGGMIQPIRRHVGDAAIEQAVFALEPGQVSTIIPVANQFAILQCEARVPARDVPLESVRDELVERIKEEKLRDAAGNLFEKLQNSATIQNVWNDPQLRQQMPGIVATINGQPISYTELAEECLLRHGEEVLHVEISHLLLQQELGKQNVAVTQQDMDGEISHAAKIAGVVNESGAPDLDKWFEIATKEQGVTKELYLRDSVWPSAALKKLTSGNIRIEESDLTKGFEANYGPRIRCRAIVLGDMRRAQEVWAKARQNASLDYFAALAEEYSIEGQTKALRGEVPPIRRFGGQPAIEDAAFELADGELSGIIQMGDKFVILKCEGRTEPIEVNHQEVRDILYQDIFEKKLRIAMNDKFVKIRAQARIDNYLAGASQSPDRLKPTTADGRPQRDTAVRPASGSARR